MGVLQFMASNGLVANPTKTVFLMLNSKRSKNKEKLTTNVDKEMITQSDHTKQLGIEIQEDQKWDTHFTNLKNALNFRPEIVEMTFSFPISKFLIQPQTGTTTHRRASGSCSFQPLHIYHGSTSSLTYA